MKTHRTQVKALNDTTPSLGQLMPNQQSDHGALGGKAVPGFGNPGKGHHESRAEHSPLVAVLPEVTLQGYFTESPLTSLQGVSLPHNKKRSELREAAAQSGLEAAEGSHAVPEDRPQPCRSPPRLCADDPAGDVCDICRARKAEVELSH